MEGNLTFQPGTDHPSGYTRIDVVWSDFGFPYSPGTNYRLNFGVRINNGTSSGQCVDVALTEGSMNAALTTGSISASSTSVDLMASDIGSLGLTAPLTLFSIYYVGSPGGTVSFTWRTSPANQVIDLNNPTQVWYPALGSDHSQVFPARTISGSIFKPPFTQSNCSGGQNAAVTGVTVSNGSNVTCSPAQQSTSVTNQINGYYAFTVNEKFSYTVRPEKTNNNACGVNTLDVTMITQHTNGNSLFQYVWQVIAGDMNLDQTVTAYDAVLVQKLINGTFVPPAGWYSWTFPRAIDYGYFPPVNSPAYHYPQYNPYWEFPNLNLDQPFKDFVGIKKADVDGSCSDCDSEFDGEAPQDRVYATTYLELEIPFLTTGDVYEIPVKLHNWNPETQAMAFALSLPENDLEILGIKEGALPFLRDECFNWEAMSKGLLRFSWLNMGNTPVKISSTGPLFYMTVKAKQNVLLSKESIRLRPDIQDCSMATTSLERLPFQLALNISETSKEQRLVAYPNPAKDFLTFEIEVPTGAPFVVVEITTADGKRVLAEKYPSNEEIQTLTIPIGGLPNGLLMYKVSSGDRTLQGKFIKLN